MSITGTSLRSDLCVELPSENKCDKKANNPCPRNAGWFCVGLICAPVKSTLTPRLRLEEKELRNLLLSWHCELTFTK